MKLRKLFRFRLISLMVVFTVVAIATAYFSNALRATKQEQQRIEELRATGFELHYLPSHAFDDENKIKLDRLVNSKDSVYHGTTVPPPMPKALWPVFGKEGLSRIGSLHLDGETEDFSRRVLTCEQLAAFQQIHTLHLNYVQLRNLKALRNLPNLQTLTLNRCDDLRALNGLEHCKNLIKVHISHCDRLVDFQAVAKLPRIETLYIKTTQPQLASITGVERCGTIKRLSLLGPISRQVRPEQIGKLKLLEHLTVDQLKALTDLDQFSELKNLKRLRIDGRRLTELSPLADFPQLESLHIERCENIDDFSGLWSQTNFQELILQNCDQLSHLKDELQCGNNDMTIFFGELASAIPLDTWMQRKKAVISRMPQEQTASP